MRFPLGIQRITRTALLICGLVFAPIALLRAETVQPLEMMEIAPGVFAFQGAYQVFTPQNKGAISNVGFIIGDAAVAVIDSGGSVIEGESLRAAIRARTQLPIRYVINTHMHPDHIFGNAAFAAAGTDFAGHAKLHRAMMVRGLFYIRANMPLLGKKASEGLKIVLPTIAVQDTLELDLGNRIIRLEAHPTAHTDNDLTVFDTRTKTLFAGDLLFSKHVPALDGSLNGWLMVMDKLRSIPAERVVPGHGPVSMPWPQALEPQENYLRRLHADVSQAIEAGIPLAEAAGSAAQSQRQKWLLFDEFNARNAAAAYAELEWD